MNTAKSLRLIFLASAAALAIAGCSDTDISSPGASAPPTSPPPPPPPPPPPAASTIDLVPTAGCPTGTSEITLAAVPAEGFSDVDVCALGDAGASETTITSDIEIPANTAIALRGAVFIGADGGTAATLTLNEGVRFFGAAVGGTGDGSDDYLVINRGSDIIVDGTETNPVRMTARAAINDEEAGTSIIENGTQAQWGGLILNGFAPINACIDGSAAGGTADCEKQGEGASGLFGGDDPADDSGSISYLTVEYAGARLTNDDELNGIAFQGIGSGTTVDHIQVHNNLDDGVEWFGGTVDASYVVITGAGDDSLDWTDGWTGSLQYAVVYSDVPTSGDPRGIEADNREGDPTKTPVSSPNVSNFTLVGTTGNQQGILLRRGMQGLVVNGIVGGGFNPGFDIDGDETYAGLGTDLIVASHFIDAVQPFADDDDDGANDDNLPAVAAANNIETGNNSLSDRFFPGTEELSVPVYDVTGQGSLEPTTYIGAFSPTETAASNWANFALTGTLFPPAGCPTGTTEDGTLDGKTLCVVPGGALADDLTLANGDELIYELGGTVVVGADLGPDATAPLPGGNAVTLTIEPGVTVVAEGNDDYLIVARGSRLVSNGTESAPVVFTAKGIVDGSLTATDALKGVWGGLVLNGRGEINACIDGAAVGGTAGCEKQGEGASGLFGGNDNTDNSGRLRYTRVQYAGVRLTNDDELNGIAFQGTGSGTEVSYVQVANNLDDGIEWFGGATSADHVVVTGVGDDSLDWTDGWVGSLQYAIAYPGVGNASEGPMSSDPRGIEADNREGNPTKTPVSAPNVSNFTLVNSGDPATQQGVLLRRGMQGVVVNGIVVDWSTGLDIDGTETLDNETADTLTVESIFLDNTENFETVTAGVFDPADNIVEGANTLSGFTFVTGATGVVPADGGAEDSVPVFDVDGVGDLVATTFIGAVENAADDWYLGWTVDLSGDETSN